MIHPVPTAADHEAYMGYGSTTWLCALENAEQNWTEHFGRAPYEDAEHAQVREWARSYITDGLQTVYESDDLLDLIAGAATTATTREDQS